MENTFIIYDRYRIKKLSFFTLRMPVSSDENSYQTEWLANSVKLTFFEDGKPDRVYILPFDQTDIV